MSPLLKTTAISVAGAMAGSYLGDYLAPKVPSVPSWLVTGGAEVIVIYLALRFTHAAK